MKKILSFIIKYSIYLLVFLLPLFFLPFSFEKFEFNKQYLLFFLVSLCLLAWLCKMVLIDKEIRFRRSPLDIFILAFLLIGLLSVLFSVNRNASFFGFYGRFSDSFISLLSLGIFYFLLTNNVKAKQESPSSGIQTEDQKLSADKEKASLISSDSLIKLFIWSLFFVVLLSYLSIFGFFQKINQFVALPQIMLRNIFNPASGTMEGLAVFLAIAAVFLTGWLIIQKKGKEIAEKKLKLAKTGIFLLWLSILGLLVIIGFSRVWLIILLTMLIFMVFALWKRLFKEEAHKLSLPIVLILLSASLLLFNNLPVQEIIMDSPLPREEVLSPGLSWSIGLTAATDNIKSFFLGSGIGNFHYAFAGFRPLQFNQSDFWQIRFNRSGSYLSEILATMGFIGLLAYLALISVFILASYLFLQKNRSHIFLFMTFLALLISQIFFYQNIILAFAFWLVLALSVINWQKPLAEKVFLLKNFPELSLIFSTALVVLLIFTGVIYFFGAKFYLANVSYNKYLASNERSYLERAVELNPYQAQYKIVMARHYLNKVLVDMNNLPTSASEEVLSMNIYLAINYAKEATELSPNRVDAWETLGLVYRELQETVEGANQWAVKSFEKAIILDPINPILPTELGKLYLAVGETDKAKESFEKARQLKPDYSDVLLQTALVEEAEGNTAEAIKQMEELVSFYPQNVEFIFQLGRLYMNNNQIDKAIAQLEKAVEIFPNHSNSLYSLAASYQRKGETEKAISYFEKVLEINPGNEDVIQRLQSLREIEREALEQAEEDLLKDEEELPENRELEILEEPEIPDK